MKKSLCLIAAVAMMVTMAGTANAAVSAYCQGITTAPLVQIEYTTRPVGTGDPVTDSGEMLDTIAFDWSGVTSYNFRSYYDMIFCLLEPLSGPTGLLKDLGPFVGLLKGEVADVNGPLFPDCKDLLGTDPDDSATDPSLTNACYCDHFAENVATKTTCSVTLPISANGLTDGTYELAILSNILNTPSHPLHAQVLAQYKANVEALAELIDAALVASGYLSMLAIVPGAANLPAELAMELGGLATLKDNDTNAALDVLLGMLEDLGLTPPEGGVGSICDGFTSLGKYGDYDNDGFTNFEEYEFYKGTAGFNVAAYLAKTSSTTISIDGPVGSPQADAKVTLSAHLDSIVQSDVTYQWKKDGQTLADETGSALVIDAMSEGDAGSYVVAATYDSAGKAVVTVESAPYVLKLAPAVPVASGLGLALLAGVCAMGGALGLRRK